VTSRLALAEGELRRLIGEAQRRPEKLHLPFGAEAVERGFVRHAIAHDPGKLGEEGARGGVMRTKRSSPIAGIVIGASAPLE
jgi:hypothetical protein